MKRGWIISTLLLSSLVLAQTAHAETSAIKDCSKKITITSDDAELYKDSKLNESKTAKKGTVYEVKGYRTINKKDYYRVYQGDTYKGYIYNKAARDLKAVKTSTGDKFLAKENKNVWANFYWNNKKSVTTNHDVYFRKYEYTLGDGKKYSSIYKKDQNNKEKWCGYLYSNSLSELKGTKLVASATITKEGPVYRDLYLNESSQKIEKGRRYQVVRYYTLGKTRYYSLYDNSQEDSQWIGYVSEDDLKLAANPNNENEVKQAYSYGTDTGAATLPAKINKVDTVTNDTVRGVDLTVLQAEKSAGVQYKNYNGKTLSNDELMSFLKENGVNYVNLKVAVNPYNDKGESYGGGNPTLENAIKTAKIAKQAGLKVNINLLFSDFYTSKDNQKLPKGWTNDNVEEKATDYITETMDTLNKEVKPDMVTVGSNMNDNFLSQSTDKANELLSKVTKIIREKDKDVKIALSYASPYKDWYWQIMDRLEKANVEYDVMGTDIYPAWDKIENIQGAKESAISKNKKFMVTSVSYPFTEEDSDGHANDNTASDIVSQKVGSVSPQGQASYMRKLYAAITPDNTDGGAGVFYNNALWIAVKAGNKTNANYNREASEKYGTGWVTKAASDYVDGASQYAGASAVDNQALFDDLGQPLQSLSLFKQLLDGQNGVDDIIPGEDPWETGGETGLKDQKATVKKVANMAANTMRGVDISSYQALKEAGVKFYDENGKEESLLKVLHDHGVNYIRLRLWNDPYADKDMDYQYDGHTYKVKKGDCYGGGNTDLKHMLEIGKEASKYGMKVLLDYHYSDFWADPATQKLPKAWANKNDSELRQAVYDYTKDTLQSFKEAGIDVGMVQVGNEITNGMMGVHAVRSKGQEWDYVWKNKERSSRVNGYLKSGIKAVRTLYPNALVATHLESVDADTYKAIMDTWKRDGVDYDVLGTTYYAFWSSNQSNLKAVQKLAAQYGKMFAVLEISWPNTLKDDDGTPNSIGADRDLSQYGASVQGQVNKLTSVYQDILSEANGLGAFYWEPAWLAVKPGWQNWEYNQKIADEKGTGWASQGCLGYYPNSKMFYNGKPAWGGSSWDNQALFDPNGHPLQSLNFYKDSISDNHNQSVIKIEFKYRDKEIKKSEFIRMNQGDKKDITIPEVKGYVTLNGQNMTIKADKEYQTITVNYEKTETMDQYVTVAKENYNIWSDLNFSKANVTDSYHHTYHAKEKITKGSNTYYHVYDKEGHSVGYINSDAVKNGKGEQGAGIACDELVTLSNGNYKVLKNFNWQNQATQGTGRIMTARYRYYHMNGSVYYSLYNIDDEWVGYINVKGTSKASVSSLTDMNKNMTTTKDTWLYNNSHLETKTKVKAKTTYTITGKRTINGKTYLKAYQKGSYKGYVLASDMK